MYQSITPREQLSLDCRGFKPGAHTHLCLQCLRWLDFADARISFDVDVCGMALTCAGRTPLTSLQAPEARSRVHFSSCHKTKGAEFQFVQMADDFLPLVGLPPCINTRRCVLVPCVCVVAHADANEASNCEPPLPVRACVRARVRACACALWHGKRMCVGHTGVSC